MEKTLEPCHSEASNISATSQETLNKHDKNKDKIDEKFDSKHVELDLKLATTELPSSKQNPNSKLELNLFKSSDQSKTFTCTFCKRDFSTSQALGGHQNAHKQERAMAKNRHVMADMAAAGGPPPFGQPARYSSFPFYGTLSNRSLGVRADSMIQKHYYHHHHPWASSSFPYGYRFGHEKMPRVYLKNLPSSSSSCSYDRLRIENIKENSGLGVDKIGVNLHLGVNMPKAIDVEKTTICKGSTLKAIEGDNNQTDDGSGLDLNLKL